jgi:hypothetical protein
MLTSSSGDFAFVFPAFGSMNCLNICSSFSARVGNLEDSFANLTKQILTIASKNCLYKITLNLRVPILLRRIVNIISFYFKEVFEVLIFI